MNNGKSIISVETADKMHVDYSANRMEYVDCLLMIYNGSALVAVYDACTILRAEILQES